MIDKGAVIGDEILFEHDSRYKFAIKVSSPHATVFQINKKKFIQKFPRESYHALEHTYPIKLEDHMVSFIKILNNRELEYDPDDLFNFGEPFSVNKKLKENEIELKLNLKKSAKKAVPSEQEMNKK